MNDDFDPGQFGLDAQVTHAGVEPSETTDHATIDPHNGRVGGLVSPPADPTTRPVPICPSGRLEDASLLVYSDALDDFEDLRKRTTNRIEALRRVKNLSGSPEEARLVAMLAGIEALEAGAVKDLERAMKAHPLGPWITAQKGVGLKQAGRLLGTIGDPYWHSRDDRSRTVSELWALCGYHVIPGQPRVVTHRSAAGDDDISPRWNAAQKGYEAFLGQPDSHPGQHPSGTHARSAGVAARRRKGVKANWNSKARSRAWCIAESIVKTGVRNIDGQRTPITPWGKVYLDARDHYTNSVHLVQCQNHARPPAKSNGCGTGEHPEWGAPGSPLRPGHIHARAMRKVAKELLKDMWRESRRIHEEQS